MRFAEDRFIEIVASDSKTIRLIDEPYCQGCNVPVLPKAEWCDGCIRMHAPFSDTRISRVVAPSLYIPWEDRAKIDDIEDDVDIYDLKIGRYHDEFANLIVDQLNGRDLLFDDSVLIPIPSSNSSSHDSMINFAGALSSFIDGSRVAPILSHNKRVHPQKTCKTIRDRELNIRNSMCPRYQRSLKGQVAYLVDDIITSGWTMREAARVVRSLNPDLIVCVAAARTMDINHLISVNAMMPSFD
jgi:predicted amidophosphoribosyltransferase